MVTITYKNTQCNPDLHLSGQLRQICRALLIGSCLGAKLGVEGIPMEWIEKVWEEVVTHLLALF